MDDPKKLSDEEFDKLWAPRPTKRSWILRFLQPIVGPFGYRSMRRTRKGGYLALVLTLIIFFIHHHHWNKSQQSPVKNQRTPFSQESANKLSF
jgi:hypothetical protein